MDYREYIQKFKTFFSKRRDTVREKSDSEDVSSSIPESAGPAVSQKTSRDIRPGRDYFEMVEGDVYTGDTHIHPPDGLTVEEQSSLHEAYLNQQLESCGQVFLRGIDRRAASQELDSCLHLEAIYTALLTQSAEHTEWQQAEKPERRQRRLSALAQLNQHPRLVLLGDPGSGKSTFVNFVTMCLAGAQLQHPEINLSLLTAPLPDENGEDEEEEQVWDDGALLPLRIILRDFAARGLPPSSETATAKHLWDFLGTQLEETTLGSYAAVLQQQLRKQGGLILFDGLDEVQEADQRRTQIKQVVEDVARVFPRCRILVTSRTYAYQQQEWRLSGFTETVLASFSQGHIRRFIDRWYRHSAQVRRKNTENALGQAELLKRTIMRSPRLYSLAERPLLLTLMASLHYWRGGSLPEKREELYNDTVELLLDWWESPKILREQDGRIAEVQESLIELLNVEKEPVRKALELIAFQAHRQQSNLEGTADIAEPDLVAGLMALNRNKDLQPARLIDYLSQRAGLLVSRGVRVYTFPHRTFQEYLAACFLTDSDEYPDNIADLARQDPNRWREVLLLAGAKAARGAAASVWGLADALCYRVVDDSTRSPEDAWGALLAGQVLVETANLTRISDRHLSKAQRIRSWLAAILSEQEPRDPFPAVERALTGNLLARLGDPRPGIGVREDRLPDIEWCEVPAGSFLMGSDPKKDNPKKIVEELLAQLHLNDSLKDALERQVLSEQPQHEVLLSTYQISRYPVTNAQYQAFIEDGGYTEQWSHCWTKEGWKWRTGEHMNTPASYGGAFDLPNHPVVGVSWYEATAFCHWLTLRLQEIGELSKEQDIRLPTEAEWEKAARGEDDRLYSWGDDISSERANYSDTGLGITSTVGCFPRGRSPYNCEEMIGNVWEWCLDWFDDEYYTTSPKENPPGPAVGSGRIIRSGSWFYGTRGCRAAFRFRLAPDSSDDDVGFRLLRTPL